MAEPQEPMLPPQLAPMNLVLDSAEVKTGASAILGMIATIARIIPGNAGIALANIATLLRSLTNNDDFRDQVVEYWNSL